VRQDSEYFSDIKDVKLSAEMLDIAQEIIARKAGHFDPEKFTDRYEEALVEMLRAKQSGEVFTAQETTEPGNVVNIMDALRKSLQASGGDAGEARRPRAASKKAAEAPAKVAAKPPARKVGARKAAR
jgi:DNA end-binding protein Ku